MMGHSLFLIVLIGFSSLSLSIPVENCTGSCQLPACKCLTTKIPKGFSHEKTPQIILVTFDDGFTERNIDYYRRLSDAGFTNPNGCPISFTFFISGENNYNFSREMYDKGHEMASHSVSHKHPYAAWRDMSYEEYKKEIIGIKNNLVKNSGIPENQIKGFRSPFLQMGGNTQFNVLKDLQFSWDSSIVMGADSYQNLEHYWPFTLDTPLQNACEQEMSNGVPGRSCMNKKCPSESYPGLWEVPVNRWYDNNKNPCSLFDGCNQPRNKTEFIDFMMKSFYKNYNSNRAPADLFLHVNWVLSRPNNFDVLKEYLEIISQKDDVWILSISKALEWIKNPKKLKTNFEVDAWNC